MTEYEPVIGLEVHCQLKTATKMFTACPFTFGAEPNTLTDPYTLGLPGTLPVPSRAAVDAGIALALALGCELQPVSRFARKHYFYPDLPKGYQITQSDQPYALGGTLAFPNPDVDADGEKLRTARLTRIHFEEDAGKNVHDASATQSLLDFNRAGAPLLEIVGEPDLRSAAQAAAYLRELRSIIRALEISDANMEEGTLRCDANVSVRERGSNGLGVRCEIKNLNSFRFLEQAVRAEIGRQTDLLRAGEPVASATMSFDPATERTQIMRSKEDAADYRYFPEPDLPPLHIDAAWIDRVRRSLPELPAARRERYEELELAPAESSLLVGDPALGEFFDGIVAAGAPPSKAANWLTVELLGLLHRDGREIAESPLTPAHVAMVIALVQEGTLSARTAKEVFGKAYDEAVAPIVVVARDGYRQESDEAVIEAVVQEVIDGAGEQLAKWRAGNAKVRGWFVGQVMKRTGGQANPRVVNAVLDRLLPPVENP